jgi:hypothetical protein
MKNKLKLLVVIAALLLTTKAKADNTIFQPTIFSTGSSLTIQSGITATFASGSTVNFTGATVTGLSAYEPALGNPSTSGYVLSSTTGGTRSWIAPSAGGGAPTDALYLTATLNASLSNEVNIGALATGLMKATISVGTATISTITDNSTNWNTAFTERAQWDGGATNLVAATGRTNLGGTTVGQSFFTLTNPSAITFPKISATNVVTAESAATYRTSIGATTTGGNLFTLATPGSTSWLKISNTGTVTAEDAATTRTSLGAGTGNGTVTNIATTSPVQGGAITGTGTISLNLATDFAWTTAQSMTLTNASTGTSDTVLQLVHNTSGAAGAGFGVTQWFRLENASGSTVDSGQFQNNWSNATAGSETSYYDLQLRNAGAGLASAVRVHGEGSISVGTTTAGGAGFVNANTGYKIAGTNILPVSTANAGAPSGGTTGQVLAKNSSTNYDYSWKSFATFQGTVRSPTGATSAVMMGLGSATYGSSSITPTTSGKIVFSIAGATSNTTLNSGIKIQLRYGTSTAPTNGAALTGTTVGPIVGAQTLPAAAIVPFSAQAVITGLSTGTAYWLDCEAGNNATSGTVNLFNVTVSAYEIP